jgi:hypothetical protein
MAMLGMDIDTKTFQEIPNPYKKMPGAKFS